jgi:beta-lactamase superfamily II metal-dependent hydrolase
MEERVVSRRGILIVVFVSFLIVGSTFVRDYFYFSPFVVFCDVGQGDATYIRLRKGFDVLVDVGPNKKVLSCLGKYMPFFDRTIEIVFVSHPQKDHFGGLEYVIDRYKIKMLFSNSIKTESSSYRSLINKISKKNIILRYFISGDHITFNGIKFTSFWPAENYKTIYSDPNEVSIVMLFATSNKNILFTGDVDKKTLDVLSNKVQKINILKVPHHGSKNSLSRKFYYKTRPDISIINVGANNSYGLPSQDVLNMLKEIKSEIRRTDKEGSIKINFK